MALAFGAMVGWSWVALTGVWIAGAGAVGAMLAFLAGGGVLIFVGLTYAELAAAMPQVGGEHVYSGRALGRTASFICTWAILLGYTSVVAFEAVALPTVLEYLLPGFSLCKARQAKNGAIVVDVFKGTDASKQGVRSGHSLISIEGQPIDALSLEQIMQRLRKTPVDSPVTLLFQTTSGGLQRKVLLERVLPAYE